MSDPTIEEMRDYLKAWDSASDEFDIEEAIYWFAAHYHGGQWTNLYRALCASKYKPGPLRNQPETPFLYEALLSAFVK